MSLISAAPLFTARNSRSGYQIEQSLRFDGSSHLNKALSTPTNAKKGTLSFWAKRSPSTGTHTVYQGSSNEIYTGFDNNVTGDNTYGIYLNNNSVKQARITTQLFRDPSAWYHIVIEVDTTQSSAADRLKLYVNGSEVTSFGTSNAVDQNDDVFPASTYRIGSYSGTTEYYEGYLAEFHHVDGTALDPTDFGEFDNNGVWRPKRYTGSHGSNGFYLKFDPTATNGIGHDHSGNGNNWTPTGFDTTNSTASTYDVMSDTPTNNYCTWNPLVLPNGYSSTQDGNLVGRFTNSANGSSMPATFAVSSGKWYWETTLTATGGGASTGVALDTFNYSAAAGVNYLGGYSSGWAYQGSDGNKRNSPTNTSYGSTYTTGDIIGIALDMGTGKIWWSKNGTWQASGDPAAGTNEAFSNITGTVVPAISGSGSGGTTTWTLNAGQRAFAYTPPTGYKALNTANLPAPDIADGSDYFNTVLYTGTSSTQSITGVGFQPDLAWVKRRDSAANSHALFDAVRGAGERLSSNETTAEVDNTSYFTSFDSDGFSVALNGGETNLSGATYVAWNWKAGGSGSSIAAGSVDGTNPTIASTVSASPSSGFSVVSYTGTGSAATVGHGLGVAPSMVFTKYRNAVGYDWYVYHKSVTSGKYLRLNTTEAEIGPETTLYSSAPSSTVINYGSSVGVVANGGTYIAYCFAEVEGFSKAGKYTATDTTDGQFIHLGFTPALILIKNITHSGWNWVLLDDQRIGYNPNNYPLYANTSSDESSSGTGANDRPVPCDFLSNGFKPRINYSEINGGTGGTNSEYIYFAWASNPFGGSGVSPATSR